MKRIHMAQFHGAPTGDETADFLLRQLGLLARIGSPAQKRDVKKWRALVVDNAGVEEERQVVNFAQGKDCAE